jgi:hypothetical protein
MGGDHNSHGPALSERSGLGGKEVLALRPIRRNTHLINAEPPRPRTEAVRIVDMSASNSWAEFAALFRNTRSAFLDHERAKSELKALMPEDAKEAIGHGVKAKRSKSGAVSFDVLETEATHAPVQ